MAVIIFLRAFRKNNSFVQISISVMDIVGFCGFAGRSLHWLDEERFVFSSGAGLCVFDVVHGPRGFVWRTDDGVGSIASCAASKSIAVAHDKRSSKIEIITSVGYEVIATLKNPTTGKVVDMAFSMDGNRLLVISDFSDHAVFMYDLTTHKMLFCAHPNSVYEGCELNPINNDMFILRGKKGLCLGTIREYLDEHLVDLRNIRLPGSIAYTPSDEWSQSGLSSAVGFATWAPRHTLYIGTADGIIYQINIKKNQLRVLSSSIVSESSEDFEGYPRAGVVTSTHLVVGTSEGVINWYTLADFEATGWIPYSFGDHSDAIAVENTYLPSAQLLRLRRDDNLMKPLCTIVHDPTFICALVGSSCGAIYKIGLNVNVAIKSEGDDDIGGQSAVFSATGSNTFDNNPTKVELFAEPIYDLHDGVPLCSTAYSIPIIHAEGGALVDLLVLGSHRGQVSFWRSCFFDEVVSSPRDTKIGPIPKIPKLLCRGTTADKSAVTSVELLSVGASSGARMMAVGTASGWLEVWLLEAFADEESEEEDEQIPVVLSSRVISRRKLFNSAISGVKNSSFSNYVSVISAKEDFVYIFNIENSATFQRIDTISLSGGCAAAVIWTAEHLYVACKDGKIFTFDASENFTNQNPQVWEDQQLLPAIHNAHLFTDPAGNVAIYTSLDSRSVSILSKLPTGVDNGKLQKGVGLLSEIASVAKAPAMSNTAICSAISLDASHFATGCTDGTIHVYTIKHLTDGPVSLNLVQTHTPHGAAVLSVCFTVDSAQLVSCAADSSIFYTSVGHEVAPKDRVLSVVAIDDLNRIKTVEDRIEYNFEDGRVVRDVSKEEEDAELINKFARQTGTLLNEVSGIRDRIATLISKNEDADPLEKMDLSEFVVDVLGRDNIVAATKERVQKIYEHYSNVNATNELIAARIRQVCWDSMERRCRRLFPLNQSVYNIKALEAATDSGSYAPSQFQYVSSFPTKALSDSEQAVLGRVMRYRAVEIRCQRLRCFEKDGSIGSSVQLSSGSWRSTWEPNNYKWNPVTISWLMNDGERWPSEAVIDELLRREKERLEDDGKAKDDEVATAAFSTAEDEYDDNRETIIDENSIFNMLLPPTAVRSVIQKRNQIVLLKEFCRIIKIKFNGAFDKLCSEKDDSLASIEARYVRIREIFSELGITQELHKYSLHDIEILNTDVKLGPADVSVIPYESAAVKERKAKEAEEKRKRDAEKDKADVKGRALVDMMNGVLEVKKDMFATAATIQKPTWYVDGLTVDKMNDSQRKEFEEYEALVAVAEEEQNKYRKLLEMEIKKLRGEVVDICKAFDDKLLHLSKLRMLTQRELLAQEMYISNLSFSMVKREKLTLARKQTEKKIEDARERRNIILARMDNLSNRIEEQRSQLTVVQEEERAMDRTFRRDIQSLCNVDFDQETLRVLQTLYRIRHYPRKTPELDEDGQPIPIAVEDTKRNSLNHSRTNGQSQSQRRSFGGGNSVSHQGAGASKIAAGRSRTASKGNADGNHMGMLQEAALGLDKPDETGSLVNTRHPFYKEVQSQEKAKQETESHYPLLSPLYMDRDCPDGFNVDQFVWVKLQELRHSRIEREVEAKHIAHEIHLLKVKLDHVSHDDNATVAEIEALKSSYASATAEIATLDSDLDLIVAIRQGQDEVDHDAVATDYSKSKLIPAAVTNRYNSCINELGNEKIGVLTRTKQFRRKMNLIAWEAVHHGMEVRHLEELYTDAQMLKVTRDLQRVIREGSDPEQVKARLERIGTRKHYLNNAFEKKLDKANVKNSELKHSLQDRIEENAKLGVQIDTLSKDVNVRKDVRQARGIDHAAHEKKMKRLISRRHLVDQVRMQAEQIDYLKDELDKLRQKTYPSFVRATRTRLAANPDETGQNY